MRLYSKKSGKLLLVLLIVIVSLKSSFTQSFSPNSSFVSYWQIQADAGTSLFFGDIKQYQWWPVYNYENEWKFALGLQLNKQISPVFAIRGQGLYGNLAGTRREWNKHFETNYFEFNLNTTVNINNIFARYRNDRFLNAYLIFGLGLINYNTSIYELGSNKLLQSVGNGNGKSFGGRTLEGVFLGGLGLDFRLTNRMSLNLETANRIMNSDMLDGHISHFKYDVYNITTLGIAYKFGYSNKRGSPSEYRKTTSSSRSKTDKIENAEYDYSQQPIQPPLIKADVLVIPPVVKREPIKEVEVLVVEEEPVYEEVIVKEEPVQLEFEYRVQIRAKYGNAISINHLSNIYNISTSQIKQNRHNGYYIYTVGSFSTYEQARVRRNELRLNNGITDAFVVAFRNGSRLYKLP